MFTEEVDSLLCKSESPKHLPAAKFTQPKTQILRIKDELKYLYMEKQQLNTKLYQLNLLLANTGGNSWQHIQHTINRKLEMETKSIYQRLDNKLHNLAQQKTNSPRAHHTFYPRIVNNTDITFSSKETGLLQKGPKYNLHHKKENWLTNLALEAETAISLLPTTDREYFRNRVSDHLHKLKLHDETNAQRNHQSEHRTMK